MSSRPFRYPGLLAGLALMLAHASAAPTNPPPAAAIPPVAPAALAPQLTTKIAASRLAGATWGAKVISLDTGKTLFATNATRLLVPASCTKLFTCALALDRLGADHRLATSLRSRQAPGADGTLPGNLLVVGGGDPTFTARLHKGRWENALAPLVTALKDAGVRRIAGDLVCDAGAFRGPPYGSGWEWDALSTKYGPVVSALTFNDNVVHLTAGPAAAIGQPVRLVLTPAFAIATNQTDGTPLVMLTNSALTVAKPRETSLRFDRLPGSTQIEVAGEIPVGGERVGEDVSVPSPARYFGCALREALAQAGITVAGGVRVAETPTDADGSGRELAAIPSPSVGDLVRETLKPSQNLYAQLLLLATGAETERHPRDPEKSRPRAITTEAAGLRALEDFLKTAAIPKGEVLLQEGSGMARANLVTANALVQLLTHMSRHRAAQAWFDALPIGGVDGTLKARFTTAPTKGNVRAKTGTLDGVSALAGYVITAAGEHLAFAILVNNYAATGSSTARIEEDALVSLLAALNVRSE